MTAPHSLRSPAGWILGCALWVAAIWAVAEPWEGRRIQPVAVATLPPSERTPLKDAFALEEGALEHWERFGCTLIDEANDPNVAFDEPLSLRMGWQVLTRRVRCEEGGAPFWAAWHRLGVEASPQATPKRQIASATLPGPLVVSLLEDVIPRHANRALKGMLVTYGEELRLHSRRWRVPSFLLDQVRLTEDSSVVLSAVRARLGEGTLELEAKVDVTLSFVFESRRVISPKRRPPRRFHVRMTEQLAPMRLGLRVLDDNAVRVDYVNLERRGCQISDVPFLSQLFSLDELCDDALSTLQVRVESELKDAIGAQVGDVIQQFELAPLLAQLVDPWIRGAVLDDAFKQWWDDLSLGLQSLQLSPTEVRIALEGAAPWTAAMPPWTASQPAKASRGRVQVSSVALMSLVQALFERPAGELLEMAEAFDEPAVAEQLSRLQRTVEASGLMREEAVEAGESLDAALALLGLEVELDAVIRPRFWVESRNALGVGVEDLRALSVRGGEAGLSFTGWARVRWGTSLDEGLAFEAWSTPERALQVALAAFGHAGLSARDATRLRAQLRLMRDGIARVPAQSPLRLPLPALGELSVGGTPLEIDEFWGDPDSQTIGLELHFGRPASAVQ